MGGNALKALLAICLLTACESPTALHPRVLHLTPEGAFVYDTFLRTTDDKTIIIPDGTDGPYIPVERDFGGRHGKETWFYSPSQLKP